MFSSNTGIGLLCSSPATEGGTRKQMEQTSSYCLENLTNLSNVFIVGKWSLKILNETQAPHIFFFTLLVMLGNYEPTCIVTIKMVTM